MKSYNEFIKMVDMITSFDFDCTRFDRLIESNNGIDGIEISSSKIFSIKRFYESTNHYNRSKMVELININFEGNILYNSRNSIIAEELEPGQKEYDISDMFIGFGIFGVTVTISCDEDVTVSDYANGIVFGFFYFIP